MGARYLKALLVIVAAVLAVGCGGDPPPPAHPGTPAPAHQDSPAAQQDSPAAAHQDTPAPALSNLTDVEACLQLRGSLIRNQGAPDILTLRIIADHVTEPRMAAEARNAVRDIDHTGVAPLPIALLRDRCARAGVQIQGR